MTSQGGDNSMELSMGDVPRQDNQFVIEDFAIVDGAGDRNKSDVDASQDLLDSESGKRESSKDDTKVTIEAPQSKEALDVEEDQNVATESSTENASKSTNDMPGPNSSPDLDFDNNLPPTVKLLTTPDGGKLYLIGTAHFSLQSQDDVSMVIKAVQPDVVSVELCRNRLNFLALDEETVMREVQDISMNKIWNIIRSNGIVDGLTSFLIMYSSANLTKALGVAPGGEFRRAFMEASNVPNCKLHLADRPVDVSIGRVLATLSWPQIIRVIWKLLTDKEIATIEDVERFKKSDLVEELMAELEGKFPAIKEVFVRERDLILTYAFQMLCKREPNSPRPPKVVGIVGIGHCDGIISNWGKVTMSDISPFLTVPPPSLSTKIIKFTIKASMLGTVCYIGYKLTPVSVKSAISGILKVITSQ